MANIGLYGYRFLSQPSLSNAGGVGLFVKKDLNLVVRNELSVSNCEFEALWVDIELSNEKIICAMVYRHPNGHLETFTNYLYATLNKIVNENKLCIILGDFNINLLNYETHSPTESFINTISSYFMIPQILQPTRVTDHSATLIDNIFINSVNYHTISGNLLADLSDHFPIFFILNKYIHQIIKQLFIKETMTNCDMSSLVNEMNMVDWSITLSQNNDVNAMFDSFYSKISQVIDKHVPLKKLTKNEIKFNSKPWITPGLEVSIRKKNRLFKKYCLNKNSYSALKYQKYRNKLNKLLALSKKSYYQNYFKNNTSNVKDRLQSHLRMHRFSMLCLLPHLQRITFSPVF